MAEFAHHCSACGEMHGGPGGETEAVKIAKINAERDVEVARLARSEARQDIEAQVEVAEIEAGAQVDEAVVEAAVLEEIATPPADPEPEPEPEPAPVIVTDDSGDEEEVPAPPETEQRAPASGGGYWAGYSAS